MAAHRSQFVEQPELEPIFLPDPTGKLPFRGFQFLEGTVILDDSITDSLSPRQIRCVTRAALGQTDYRIADAIEKSTGTVSKDLKNARIVLGVYDRAALICGAFALDLMRLATPGSQDLFPVGEEDLKILAAISDDKSNCEIIASSPITETQLNNRLKVIGDRSGFYGRELLVTAAIITNQLNPITHEPIARRT